MSDEALLVIAGILAPFVVQGAKLIHSKLTGGELGPQASLGWTYAVCLVLAVVAKIASGEIFLPAGGLDVVAGTVLTQLGIVLGLATFIYKTFQSPGTSILVRH